MNKPLGAMSLAELWRLFPIKLTAPNPRWPQWYQREARLLRAFLPGESITLHHIGSTAIPGIWAKPIIDVLLATADEAALQRVGARLLRHGYLLMSASTRRQSLNKGYTPRGFGARVFHIHLRLPGDNDELYFRDYLRERPAVARAYERLKLELWHRYEHDRDGYTAAKGAFIRYHTARAKVLYGNRYGPA